MGKLIDMKEFSGTMTPIKLTATSKGVGIMEEKIKTPIKLSKSINDLKITEDMITTAINKQEYEAITVVTKQAQLSVDEKNGITEMIKIITDAHKKITPYSIGDNDYRRFIGQSFQSVLMSMLEGLSGGPKMLAQLASAAFKATTKADLLSALEQLLGGAGDGKPFVEGKEIKMDDDKE